MAKKGCVKCYFGVESGSPRTLKKINKQITIEQAYQTVGNAVDAGIFPMVSLIVGFPEETEDDLELTLKAMEKFDDMGALTQLHSLSPEPGSDLLRKQGVEDLFIDVVSDVASAGDNNFNVFPEGYKSWIRENREIFAPFYQFRLGYSQKMFRWLYKFADESHTRSVRKQISKLKEAGKLKKMNQAYLRVYLNEWIDSLKEELLKVAG
jgi:hypothetical protein